MFQIVGWHTHNDHSANFSQNTAPLNTTDEKLLKLQDVCPRNTSLVLLITRINPLLSSVMIRQKRTNPNIVNEFQIANSEFRTFEFSIPNFRFRHSRLIPTSFYFCFSILFRTFCSDGEPFEFLVKHSTHSPSTSPSLNLLRRK